MFSMGVKTISQYSSSIHTTLSKLGKEAFSSHMIKVILEKSTSFILFNDEILSYFSLRSELRQRNLFPTSTQVYQHLVSGRKQE